MGDSTTNLQESLRNGARLHAFRSGGGLRVVRVMKPRGVLIGYGEHPDIEEALAMASADIEAGQVVYNPTKPDPHFLTGSSDPSGELDAWVLGGNTFDVDHRDGVFRVELHGYQRLETPATVSESAMSGETVRWQDARGYLLESGPVVLPNGSSGTSTRVVKSPDGAPASDAWMWESFRLGCAHALDGAFAAAFVAQHEAKH